jgi:hypothetical protein
MDVPYHDANLIAVRIEDSGDIVLSFRAAAGGLFRCVLRGVRHFCCDNFREGNTILGRVSSDKAAVRERDLRKLIFALPTESPEQLQSLRESIASGSLVFYKLVESYGATVLAVCEEVQERAE